jgi:hypothetical protein
MERQSSANQEAVSDGHTGKAGAASMVGAAESLSDGHTGKAGAASMVGAAESAP